MKIIIKKICITVMLFLGYIEKFYAFLQRKSEFDKKSYDEIR